MYFLCKLHINIFLHIFLYFIHLKFLVSHFLPYPNNPPLKNTIISLETPCSRNTSCNQSISLKMISEYMNILMCTYQLLIFLVYFINNLYLCFQIPRKQKHLQKVLGIFPFSVLCLINPKQNSFLKDSHERKKYIWE